MSGWDDYSDVELECAWMGWLNRIHVTEYDKVGVRLNRDISGGLSTPLLPVQGACRLEKREGRDTWNEPRALDHGYRDEDDNSSPGISLMERDGT